MLRKLGGALVLVLLFAILLFAFFAFCLFCFLPFLLFCSRSCAGIRDLTSRFAGRGVCLCAGIRESLARFTRRPCAGRHLLFF
ncbi:hypothetical protein, partial [Paraburkholderia sp. XV]|uniref:hypothetical protein n=1 Tax=Paraburkholderia sp. XV TaxID=2831520 RepID=UPI001CD57B6F